MIRGLTKVLPQRIAAQITLVMVITLVAVVGISFLTFQLLHPPPPRLEHARDNLLFGTVLTELEHMLPEERANYIASLDNYGGTSRFHLLTPEQAESLLSKDPEQEARDGIVNGTRYAPQTLPTGVKLIREVQLPSQNGTAAKNEVLFRLTDGSYVCISIHPEDTPPLIFNPLFQVLIAIALAVVLLLSWVGINLGRPLSDLARSAAKFGQASTKPVPIIERGPTEVREVTRAFNLMQERIQDMIGKRTRMLAAIGHDLRTPLTRLKLRIALMEEGEQKQRNLADLDMMEIQLNGALNFLRLGQSNEGSAPIDLKSFLKGITDQYEDIGKSVPVRCASGLKIHARPTELNRALTNLIDNSFRYGDAVEIRVKEAGSGIILDVVDHGPGIDPDQCSRLLEPFERGDEARTYGQGAGLGLGLSITSSIVQAHGGEFLLLDTPGGGLTARMHLPLQ